MQCLAGAPRDEGNRRAYESRTNIAASAHARPPFDRAVVVVFENKSPGQVLGSGDAPTFTSYARRYATLAADEAELMRA